MVQFLLEDQFIEGSDIINN